MERDADQEPLLLTLAPDELKLLDGWISEQDGEKPTRPEAIRRLLKLLLA